LLAKEGAKLGDIKEIFTQEQAVSQCAAYLKSLGKDIKITPLANTALAAKMVAESERNDIAAIASYACSTIYNLNCLARSVQDHANNYTRFICISKKLEIYPGASRTGIMLSCAHKPGALYKVLGLIYSFGINVVKVESRPIPQRDFEFMFYFDLEVPVYAENLALLMCELESICEEFQYLGSYSEIV
jgi:chorismate mutase/prephenate dehydratase